MPHPWINTKLTVNAIFSPLDTSQTQIRVAVLQPYQSTGGHLRVDLEVRSLQTPGTFDALSWAWGDASDVLAIILEGHIWWAPKNLVVALDQLVLPDKPRFIWIDALCINQSQTTAGLAERGHQIGLMRHIYTRASDVIVWMGIEREYTDGVLELLSRVAERTERNDNAPPILPRSFHVPYKDSCKVLHFLNEPWWDRLWVLQEVGLAKHAIIHHGKAMISFSKAVFAISVLESRGHLWNRGGRFKAKIGPFNNPEFYGFGFKDRYNNRTVMTFNPRDQHFKTFTTLLIACRFRSATDPRDKIFGLFGLVPDLVLHALQPRYDETVEKTYTRTAFTLMSESHSLALLSHTTPWLLNRSAVPQLPSWVPDWSIRNEPEYWSHLPDHLSGQPAYAPSDLGSKIQLSVQDGRYLRLQGVLIDNISNKGHGYEGFWRFLDWSKHRRMLSRLSVNEPADVLENDMEYMKENRWSALLQCLSFAYIGALLDIASFKLFAFMRWIDATSHALHYRIFPNSDRSTLKRMMCEERDFEVMRTDKSMRQYFNHRPTELVSSSIFTTSDGFVGVGPAFMEPGDHVFVLAGASYPLILRTLPTSLSGYTYVGECYLAGIMQGEATGEIFGSWRGRKRKLIAESERQLNDQHGIWEEVVLG